MSVVFLGLGSNLGDRPEHLRYALRAIGDLPGVRLGPVSSFHLTEPVGGPPQGPYLNAAARLETAKPPEQTLHALQRIEKRRGRRRSVPNAPRTLDLDLLMLGTGEERRIHSSGLELPHPRLEERRFVLAPLEEIAPSLALPSGTTVSERLRELPD